MRIYYSVLLKVRGRFNLSLGLVEVPAADRVLVRFVRVPDWWETRGYSRADRRRRGQRGTTPPNFAPHREPRPDSKSSDTFGTC